RRAGERVTPFSFVQISDTHVGFSGPPNPLGTKAFEEAVALINALPEKPEFVLVTGDLTHDTEKPGEHAERMRAFQKIAGGLAVKRLHVVPGEHDAALDGGTLFREFFGETSYVFDHRGVHFVALDNVSNGKPVIGDARIEWLRKDLARFPKEAPIVVFTHRPLFDLAPEWEWFTSDGDKVLDLLAPFENATVLYGHIHRADSRKIGRATHLASRSLIFGFPDPAATPEKKPLPFAADRPFQNLGLRTLHAGKSLAADDVELSIREFAGKAGINQILKGESR
ncbi:MAG TPA: metallophosphoesterase, partial [Thermoanaerobaculia bacterium]|nr:metallophosphoesterase [Thermoanaerobaculia bacterium]